MTCMNADECRVALEGTECSGLFYDGCYMYQGGGDILMKGCLNELTEQSDAYEACSKSEESCKKCPNELCNAVHCLSCNSRDSVECVSGEGNIQYDLCPKDDKCVKYVDGR